MGVVTDNARAQPDNVCRAKVFCEYLFVIALLHSGIALLYSAQQALFRCNQCALPVDVNRAAFEHNAILAEHWPNFLRARSLRHQAPDVFILLPIRIFSPCVEAPLDAGYLGRGIFLKGHGFQPCRQGHRDSGFSP